MRPDSPGGMPSARLAAPAWQRILALARRSLERSGGELRGAITLPIPTEPERKLVIGLTGQHRPPGVKSVRIPLDSLDAAVFAETGMPLVAALAVLNGPVRNRPSEHFEEDRFRAQALGEAARLVGRHATEPWFVAWLEQLNKDGTVTRLVRRGDADQLGWACSVLALLPTQDVSLPVLAERATGNTKALSGTPIATLVLRALAAQQGEPAPTTAAQRRERWEASGVIVDDLASQVLVLGLRPIEDHVIATWLQDAAQFGIPFRLTLHQLMADPITVTARNLFVCENPAVLRAAVFDWDDDCAPLVCTEGVPSGALHRLLARAKGTIHWRGDFDWTGLRTTAAAAARYGARPWRMSTVDYLAALDAPLAETEPLRGPIAASPWEPDLALTMADRGRAVMEERLIPLLLGDLRLRTF
jgi:uncharacterized protein (TIGR02679 family)